MTVVDEIKDRLDLVELVSESVALRKSGKNYTGFCPFHPNTNTPAFVVFPDTGTWRCFGACNDGGDIFSFVMKKEGYDFPETLRLLAERAGVELRPRTPEEEAKQEEHEHLRQLLESAVAFFRNAMLETGDGERAHAYLTGRGLNDDTIEAFELGYAPDEWQALIDHLQQRGAQPDDLVAAGLASERESGGIFDRFRHRLMIPIRDGRGRMAGFGARALDPEDQPKYLNSPQTELFDKGRLLYGLDRARKSIRSEEQAVLVEGYMDVIGLHQAGYANAVSSMGTALTESQLRQIKRFARKIILALDADSAGDQATLRGLNLARQALDREADPVFDARGLVRFEGRLDAELRVVTMPAGMDPDEVVADDPAAWEGLLQGAQTVVEYVMEAASQSRDLDDPKHKAEIARQVLPLISDVADPVEREAYRQRLARHLRVDEATLQGYAVQARRRQSTAETGEAVSPRPGAEQLERFCLGVLLAQPDWLYRLDRELATYDLPRLSESDFSSQDRRLLFAAVRSSLSQHEVEPKAHWPTTLDQTLHELAHELMDLLPPMEFDRPKVQADIVASFLRLRRGQLAQRTGEVQFRLLAAQEMPDAADGEDAVDLDELKQTVHQLALQKASLERALAARGLARSAVVEGSDLPQA